MDYLRSRPTSTIVSTTAISLTENSSSTPMAFPKSEQERLFYHPIVNNLSIHIRCMLSLWEGVIGKILTPGGGGGKDVELADVRSMSSSESGEKKWSM